MRRGLQGVGAVAAALAAAIGVGVVFFVALLSGWWFLLGLIAALAVACPGALVVGLAAVRGRPTAPVFRTLAATAGAAFVLFTVVGALGAAGAI